MLIELYLLIIIFYVTAALITAISFFIVFLVGSDNPVVQFVEDH